MEHHSNIVPWQLLAQRARRVAALPARPGGRRRSRSTSSTSELARGTIKLVAVAHVSNVLGTLNPVAEITARAHAAGALCWSTARRRCPRCRSTWPTIGADFYAWTGHKALGPTGIGVLHGRRELLE